jgi:hypothetical protein
MAETARDDRLTVVAIAAIACVVQDVLHEGIGHGLTAWLSGAHRITMSTVALQSDIDTRLISANGTLVNLLFAAFFWLLLRRAGNFRPANRYFLILALMGNLFTGTGYFLFSGAMNFGDWAAVIHGLEPHSAWRVALVLVGAASYWGSMLLVGVEMQAFREKDARPSRILGLCYTPYFTDGVLAFVGGLMNPLGFFYVIASALPSTLGANAGLLSLPFVMRSWKSCEKRDAGSISRSPAWIAVGAVAIVLFVFVLGRGVVGRVEADYEMRPPIPAPAGFIRLGALRRFLAVAHRHEAGRGQTELSKHCDGLPGPSVAQSQVVLG